MPFNDKLRVIIGQGTSAEIFRNTTDPAYETVIFGNRGLWASVDRHKMGQPAHVLTLPGQPVPKYQTAQGNSVQSSQAFMDSTNYQEKLLALSSENDKRDGALHLDGWTVTGVERNKSGQFPIKVKYAGRYLSGGFKQITGDINCDQVVFATGIAPQKGHGISGVDAQNVGRFKTNRGFDPIQESLQYIACKNKPQDLDTVVVYGGGATSAWLVDMVLEAKPKHFLWIARAGGSGFTKSMLPGQRNQMTLDKVKDYRKEYEITYLNCVNANETPRDAQGKQIGFADRKLAKIVMGFKNEQGDQCHSLVDLFIYSVAGDPELEGSISKTVDPTLFKELEIVRDTNCVLGGGDAALAWGTPTRDVLVVGAATFSGLKLPDGVSAPMNTLPWGSQVPDGIAVAVSTISALNSYVPIQQQIETNGKTGKAGRVEQIMSQSNINFNLADHDQIACYLAVFYDLPASLLSACTQEIIAERSKKGADVKNNPTSIAKHVNDPTHQKAYGLSEDEIMVIINNYVRLDPNSSVAIKIKQDYDKQFPAKK